LHGASGRDRSPSWTARSGGFPIRGIFFVPPARFGAAIELPAEVTQAEALLSPRGGYRPARRYLAARSGGVQRFVLRLRHRDKAPTEIAIGLVAPSRDAEHFTLLVRERFASLELAAPVRELALKADDVVPLPGRTSASRSSKAAARPVGAPGGAAATRLGAEAVCGIGRPGRASPGARRRDLPMQTKAIANSISRAPILVAGISHARSRRSSRAAPRRAARAARRSGADRVRLVGRRRRRRRLLRCPHAERVRSCGFIASGAAKADGICTAFSPESVYSPLPAYAELHCLSNFTFLRGASILKSW